MTHLNYYFSVTIANLSLYFCVTLDPVGLSAWLAITVQVYVIIHAIYYHFHNHKKQ